jgi:Alpha-2-macroglobulin family/MG2 domain/Alpha-2-macroglobulin bait region domain
MHGNRPSASAGRLLRLGLLGGILLGLLTGLAPGRDEKQAAAAKPALVKPHETALSTSTEFFAGSPAALRCSVYGVLSLTETKPLPGAAVEVRLKAKDGKTYELYSGKTPANGIAEARFRVPPVAAGNYVLAVHTKSERGEERLEREVRVKADPKVLLVTDKPLYQPGQVIHLRALALQAFNLTPVAGADLVFEVEDPKGNKVFKRTQRTSDFGVASIDFQLADEVNLGDYRVRAVLGDHTADKTVAVQRYVLPKFKADVTADKKFYLPKETLHADLQTDYFFGKPVAGGKVKVTASTFDVQFRTFQTWEGTTDANGHAKFEIKLPDYFVGQPLQAGNALVRLEVKVTDTADHSETVNKTYPVSDQPIRVSLIPEGGRLVPEMENRVFVAAVYPDGSPAACDVKLWQGAKPTGAPLAALKTNTAGLAEFRLTPKKDGFRAGDWAQRQVEMLGGQQVTTGGPRLLYDLTAEARDTKGSLARATTAVTSEPFGENMLLRLDKAIYRTGDALQVDVHTSAGLPTAYLDVIRGGQTLLSRWLDVKDGKASTRLFLASELFGTLEVHAYQMLASGEIVRDSRVVYVQPRDDLRVTVQPDKEVYRPGEAGTIRFHVTDKDGNPTAAALGVIIVDESVYALQEMQPGLEKVYFTLQEELLKPQVQVETGPRALPPGAGPGSAQPVAEQPRTASAYRPQESLDSLVRPAELPAEKQQIAQVLLTAVKPRTPSRWEVAPALERRQKVEGQLQQIAAALVNYASDHPDFLQLDRGTGRWQFKPGLLQDAVKAQRLDAALLRDPFGHPWTLGDLMELEKGFAVDHLAEAVALYRMQQLFWAFINHTQANQARWFKNGRWTFPATVLAEAARNQRQDARLLTDPWGQPFRLVKREQKRDHNSGLSQLDFHDLVSAGPDRKFGTADDVELVSTSPKRLGPWAFAAWGRPWGVWEFEGRGRVFDQWMLQRDGAFNFRGGFQGGGVNGLGGMLPAPGGVGGGGFGGMPRAFFGMRAGGVVPVTSEAAAEPASGDRGAGGGAGAAPTRVREYFPETLLWRPALITDDRGRADLPLTFADSITTWRLTASASSRGGALGGVTAPLRVFQDFFVDLDLPVSLTQNDEVAFPVAVYNYLKEPQTVRLDLQPEPWFDLLDDAGPSRSLALKPGEVTSVRFRIRAKKLGSQPLTVKAAGSKLSDAIKRSIDVVPDGQRVEQVRSDRLAGAVRQTVTIPDTAIPDSYKLLVKLYPGVMSQVLEGTEGMLRLPGG